MSRRGKRTNSPGPVCPRRTRRLGSNSPPGAWATDTRHSQAGKSAPASERPETDATPSALCRVRPPVGRSSLESRNRIGTRSSTDPCGSAASRKICAVREASRIHRTRSCVPAVLASGPSPLLFQSRSAKGSEMRFAGIRFPCARWSRILDLGCGWGSLSLWLAERYPNSRILGVSNSSPQREHILGVARQRGFDNLDVLTVA